MLPIPPLASAAYAATQVRQSDDKIQQLRKTRQLQRNSATSGDRYEHSVESAEELQPVQDDPGQSRQSKKHSPRKSPTDIDMENLPDEGTNLDLKA